MCGACAVSACGGVSRGASVLSAWPRRFGARTRRFARALLPAHAFPAQSDKSNSSDSTVDDTTGLFLVVETNLRIG